MATNESGHSLRNGREMKWWHDTVIYEVYVQSFSDSNGDGIGDLNGITLKIDYLKDLGIGCIWLSPIMESPFADCGYDISNHYRINPEFGTMEDFQRLIKTAHESGIRVIIDFVPGYTSDKHPWFIEARKSKDAHTRDYYIWGKGENGEFPNNWYSSAAASSAWTYNEETDDYYFHAFLSAQPNLNWNCKDLQIEMLKVMEFWLNKGIDGFRVDAVNYTIADSVKRNNPGEKFDQVHIFDRNHQNIHKALKAMRKLTARYSDIMMVGEIFPGYPAESKEYYGGDNDELHLNFNLFISQIIKKGRWYDGNYTSESSHLDKNNCGFSVKEFREAIQDYDLVFSALKLWPTVVLGNHDQPRIYTSYGRLVSEIYREKMAKVMAAYTLLTKGTPFLYYGEEIGMEDMIFNSIHDFRDNFGIRFYRYLIEEKKLTKGNALTLAQNISRDICRTPMQWSTSENAGFSANHKTWLKINPGYKRKNVEMQIHEPDSILNFYKNLIKLRNQHESFRSGEYIWIDRNSNDYIAFLRKAAKETTIVILNFSEMEHYFMLDLKEFGISESKVRLLMSNYTNNSTEIFTQIRLRPVEAFIGILF